jgi:hypothetical protein
MESLFQLSESEIKKLEGLMENSKPVDEIFLNASEFGSCSECNNNCHNYCESDCNGNCETTCKGNAK